MSCCGAKSSPVSQEIDRELHAARKEMDEEIKLLLLGPGDSGKSTIAKQLRLIYTDGFSDDEKSHYKDVVRTNAIQCIKTLVQTAKTFGYEIRESNQKTADICEEANWYEVEYQPDMGQKVYNLWQDEAIQKTFARASEFQLHGVCKHVLDQTKTIFTPTYQPSVEDILMCRIRTCGAEQIIFNAGKTKFKIIDVGGQRSERRKWIHFFEGITAIIFVAAINEYNMKLYEDHTVNRMRESVNLFDTIVNTPIFQSTTILLFLNKCDLFFDKIKVVDLVDTFPDYPGPPKEPKAAKEFIAGMFLAANKNQKMIFVHDTIAVDTDCIRVIFLAVKETILKDALAVLM